ncbi:hypothetical protein F511_32581 [Dorcoceras hygrometricum]|uniref:Uncharacterized protein n=1 Tax=Dorcoceras hygrometricum TaxID=472368 RepID=A0A2Z7B0N8_9LAMI|nr:hypothetical protein F511_32581 [Dorcoceras hygrometricum]
MRPITSRVFEGPERDRGAVIARSNTNIIYTCWIRLLLKVDGSWKIVEDCCRWIPMYRMTIYCEKQQPSVAAHAPICFFFEPVQVLRSFPIIKTCGWARVCTDIIQFYLFGHLEPVGTQEKEVFQIWTVSIREKNLSDLSYRDKYSDLRDFGTVYSVSNHNQANQIRANQIRLYQFQSISDLGIRVISVIGLRTSDQKVSDLIQRMR